MSYAKTSHGRSLARKSFFSRVVTLESDFKYGESKDGEKYGGNLFFWKLDDIYS